MIISKEGLSVRRPTPSEKRTMEEESTEGFYNPESGEVVVRYDPSRIHRKHVLAHELGHSRHSVPLSYGYEKLGSTGLIDLGNELVAEYYALVINPKDGEAISSIIWLRNQAVNSGTDPAIVALKEKRAIRVVGYKGRPVRR